jgi:transposase
MRSIRLDKYYSARSVLSALGGAKPYVLPKRRHARFGPE